jgi:hypothetical protein
VGFDLGGELEGGFELVPEGLHGEVAGAVTDAFSRRWWRLKISALKRPGRAGGTRSSSVPTRVTSLRGHGRGGSQGAPPGALRRPAPANRRARQPLYPHKVIWSQKLAALRRGLT